MHRAMERLPTPPRGRGIPTFFFALLVVPALAAAACGTSEGESLVVEPALAAEQEAWWAALSEPCGNAYPGALESAAGGSQTLRGDELLVVHFDVCEDDEIRLPFHIEQPDGEWDRSRTWIFRLTGDGRIELRHDHRKPDGTEDDSTWYGTRTINDGSEIQQEFIYEDREYPDGSVRGWRVIIEPGVRYVYGTIRNGEWSWRVDFDLTEPMDALPPPAWGYEGGGGPLR